MLGITVLGSGSRGNAAVIHNSESSLLIDAGFSGRELSRRMKESGVDEKKIKAILVSHEHLDHAKGVRILGNRLDIPVYCNRLTGEAMRSRDSKLGALHLFSSGQSFQLEEFLVTPFPIPHDAIDPVGFTISCSGKKIAIATDLGHAGSVVLHHLSQSDILVLESNHDIQLLQRSERPWNLKQRILSRHGHLSNVAGLEVLRSVLDERTRHVVLAHASSDCNCYDLVEKGALAFLEELGRVDISLNVARQDQWIETLWV